MNSHPVLYHRIGVRIARYRKLLYWKQADLAIKMGMSRTSISNIEQGTQAIQLDDLYRIARLFNVTVDNLLPTSNNPADYDGWLEAYED